MHKALFLDRYGILNVDKVYVYKWEDIVWIEEVFKMIKKMAQHLKDSHNTSGVKVFENHKAILSELKSIL
jgi:histidinol phosphatase-like enzyme